MKAKILENIKKANAGTVQITNYNDSLNNIPLVDTSKVMSAIREKREDNEDKIIKEEEPIINPNL